MRYIYGPDLRLEDKRADLSACELGPHSEGELFGQRLRIVNDHLINNLSLNDSAPQINKIMI